MPIGARLELTTASLHLGRLSTAMPKSPLPTSDGQQPCINVAVSPPLTEDSQTRLNSSTAMPNYPGQLTGVTADHASILHFRTEDNWLARSGSTAMTNSTHHTLRLPHVAPVHQCLTLLGSSRMHLSQTGVTRTRSCARPHLHVRGIPPSNTFPGLQMI